MRPPRIHLRAALAGALPAAMACYLLAYPATFSGEQQPQVAAARPSTSSQAPPDFQHDILPIFQKSCVMCHGGAMVQAQLRLDSEAAVLRGGAHGPAIVPGKSSESLLLQRILGLTDAPRMPMGMAPLPSEQADLIRRWIDTARFDKAAVDQASSGSASIRVAPGPASFGAPGSGSASPNNAAAANAAGSSDLFAKEVRPLLASRCYRCHGPDVQQNGLRLDSLAAVLKGSESGPVVVPGSSDKSRLVRRLMAQERPMMPYGGPQLSTEEIATIRKWIDAGAPGPDSTTPIAATPVKKHWAYMKPIRPALPAVNSSWVRNPIDSFILARLRQEGLEPSREASKTTLIRRVYLDLIGLPPTPAQVDAYLADSSPNAYEHVVDQLLASPRYGERWARPWLDLARYADSNGYEKDNLRVAWAYRDWVIKALNANMSFRDFTIEQIAGDMLPHPSNDQLIATGFNRNTLLNEEGGVDPEEYYWYELVDRTNTTASVWLGSTLGCAQCHNHKFDPFTQKDYYRFLAFFAHNDYTVVGSLNEKHASEPVLELPTPEQAQKAAAIRAQIAEWKKTLDTETPELEQAQAAWEAKTKQQEREWLVLKPQSAVSQGGATLTVEPDSSVLASGKNAQADTYSLELNVPKGSISAVRLEVLTDPSLPHNGPGRLSDGNFFLSNFDVEAKVNGASIPIPFEKVAASDQQDGYAAARILSKDPGVHGWSINPEAPYGTPNRFAVFLAAKPVELPAAGTLVVELKHLMRHASPSIGRFRISITSQANADSIAQLPGRLWPILDIDSSHRTAEQATALAAGYRAISPLLDSTRKQVADAETELKKLGIVTAQIMREQAPYVRPVTYMRQRGSFLSKGEQVAADVPSALNPLPPGTTPNRLALAEWLVSRDNPLTARVTVNRFWETIFGRGIVETTEDFGTQGDPPSHPELLDWLAVEFMDSGWDMKAILRLMVTSATYRQDSSASAALIAKDPYNRLYAHGPRFRLEAEAIHDLALSASGLLSSKMYGPSVFPYQPDGIWDVPYSSDKWIQSKGENRYRRSIYTFIRRSAPYPSLITFDAPSREFCTIRRVRTNTPLQALTTLNDPFFVDAARALAKRMKAEGGADEASWISYGFQLVAARRPTTSELARMVTYEKEQTARYQADPKSALELLGVKEGSSDPQMAALTLTANVLLNLDEVLTKE